MKYAVLGYGISGKWAEKIIKNRFNADVSIFDDSVSGLAGLHECNFSDFDRVVVSPGINISELNNPDYSKIISEVELAYMCTPVGSKIIGITGTNGKSTITYLTHQILENSNVKSVCCGNIGKTFSEAVLENDYDVYVVELSSYQIDLLKNFYMYAFCISNITPDHLDRYRTFGSYVNSKLRGLDFCRPGNVFFLNEDLYNDFLLPEGINFIDRNLKSFPVIDDFTLSFGRFYGDLNNYSLAGWHNRINLAFALALSSCVVELQGDISKLLSTLKPLEHRCEIFNEFNGVVFINDSKSTNAESVITALNSISGSINLVMGGRRKDTDYSVLAGTLNEKVKNLVLYGEGRKSIHDELVDSLNVDCRLFDSFDDAVDYSYSISDKGDTLLLSPGCSSFDQFSNFEERGGRFKNLINKFMEDSGSHAGV